MITNIEITLEREFRQAKQEGWQEGKQEGWLDAKREIARKMLRRGNRLNARKNCPDKGLYVPDALF